MTPPPTPASMAGTTLESSTTTTIENRCVICPNGAETGYDDTTPYYADSGDDRTCAKLIQDAASWESGTAGCASFEDAELHWHSMLR
jgi:hypothetical protein